MSCTVHEAQQRCSSYAFTEWRAFKLLEPSGAELLDLMTAKICLIIAFANWLGKGKKPKLTDYLFLSDDKKSDKLTDPKSQQMLAKVLTKALGGKFTKRGKEIGDNS